MNHFSRENIQRFFESWHEWQKEIPQLYEEKDDLVHEKMNEALQNYYDLLKYGEIEAGEPSILLPLNGEERLAFIKKQQASRYAFIQLDALYDESQKKAARLSITFKKS